MILQRCSYIGLKFNFKQTGGLVPGGFLLMDHKIMQNLPSGAGSTFHVRLAALLALAITGSLGSALAASPQPQPTAAELAAQKTWRAAIAASPVPEEGCFRASYPSTGWTKVACTQAPKRPYVPRGQGGSATVGNGHDYAAVTSKIIKSAIGAFPVVTGVKRETGYNGAANTYSLQLNSGFMSTAACKGAADPAACQSWEQFVYSSSSQAAFMQYWLIGYGTSCPGGWFSYQSDCYTNSAAATVPQIAITKLQTLQISATAVAKGIDTLVMTAGTEAYSTTGKDSVVDLATAWKQSEFNVVGDGGGSQAKFNKGSSIEVQIQLNDSATAAPVCKANDGTTGETNNLTLKSCKAAGGKTPAVTFTESN